MAGSAAEFLISIEQQMKGDDAVSELEKAEAAVKDGIAAYKQLEAATNKTSSQLAKVGAAATAMRSNMEAAMKANNPAAFWKAAGALEKLTDKENELKVAVDKAKTALQAQQATVSAAAGNLDKVRAANQKGALATSLATTKFGEMAGAFGALGGPIGGTAGRLFQFGDSLQKLGGSGGMFALFAGGAAIAVAAIVAITAAFVAGAFAAVKYGISLANAARDQRLNLEAMLGSKEAASEMNGAFRQIEKSTGATRERMTEVTKQLKDAGLAGDDMKTALKAIATQEKAIGQDGTGKLIEDLKAGKTSAEELGKSVESQYGGVVKDKMIGLTESADRLKGNLGALFSGLNIEPFLEAFSKFVDMFDETSSSGQAIKFVFETLFQPLVDGAAAAFPYIQLFIVKFINTLLKIGVFLKPAIDKVSELFGMEPSDTMETVMAAAEVAAIALAAAIGIVVVVIGAIVLAALSVGTAMLNAWNLAKAAWDGIKSAIDTAKDKIAAIDLAQIGKDLVDGFINGIKAGAKAVGEAVTSLGTDAKNSLKSALGIKSPSTVFAELGVHTAEGFERGVQRGTPGVEAAVSGMVRADSGDAPRRGGERAPAKIDVQLHFHGVRDDDLVGKIRREVDDIFRGIALELGTDAEEAT